MLLPFQDAARLCGHWFILEGFGIGSRTFGHKFGGLGVTEMIHGVFFLINVLLLLGQSPMVEGKLHKLWSVCLRKCRSGSMTTSCWSNCRKVYAEERTGRCVSGCMYHSSSSNMVRSDVI
jgi:hypothetical protein